MNAKTLKTTLVLAFALLYSFDSNAQSGEISGVVYNKTYENKLDNVIISIPELNAGAVTDSLGKYQISGLKAGKYDVYFSCVGYKKQVFEAEIKNGSSFTISIGLDYDILNLKEVKVTAGLGSTNISNTSIVNQIDMQLRPVNSAQDLLRMVPGLFIAQHAGGGKAEQIFLRGFDADHGTDFAIWTDGMPINMVSHAHGQGFADMHFLIPETINELDVNKGPYSAQYGDFATAGAGEFKTMNFLEQNQVKLEYGMFNTYRAMGIFNLLGPNKHFFSRQKESLYLATEYRYSDGYFDHPQHFNSFNIFTKYYGLLNNNTSLSFSVSHFNSIWDASGQIPLRATNEGITDWYGSMDPSEGGNTNRTNVNIILMHQFDASNNWKNQAYYSHYDFSLFSDFTFYMKDTAHGDEINQIDHRNIAGYQSTYQNQSTLFGKNLHSTFSAGGRYDFGQTGLVHADKRELLDTFNYGALHQADLNACLDENYDITSKLLINAGLRLDYFIFNYQDFIYDTASGHLTKPILSPKLNFYYTLNKSVQLYAKSGMGFHSNDARVVVTDQVAQTLPRAYGAEVGTLLKIGNNMLINVALWRLDLQSELTYDGDDANVIPSGRTKREGVDFGIRYEPINHIYFDMDINYNYGRYIDSPSTSNRIALAPIVTSVAGISYKSKTGFNGGLRYRYMGDRPANPQNTLTATGYFIMDAVAGYTYKRYQYGISIENLLNTKWKEAQFDTISQLKGESSPVEDINFTAGTPFSLKGTISYSF